MVHVSIQVIIAAHVVVVVVVRSARGGGCRGRRALVGTAAEGVGVDLSRLGGDESAARGRDRTQRDAGDALEQRQQTREASLTHHASDVKSRVMEL